jgi:hypothetical protein
MRGGEVKMSPRRTGGRQADRRVIVTIVVVIIRTAGAVMREWIKRGGHLS